MNSISPECQDLNKQYDSCFNKWFKDHYLNGTTDNRMCSAIFGSYQDCVKKALKEKNIELWDVQKDILGTGEEKRPPKKPESK